MTLGRDVLKWLFPLGGVPPYIQVCASLPPATPLLTSALLCIADTPQIRTVIGWTGLATTVLSVVLALAALFMNMHTARYHNDDDVDDMVNQ
jgi:hypothetical protein